MAHYVLSAESSFSAAHTLPGVDMCENMHGHNWRVRVSVRVDAGDLDAIGMGIDFRVIQKLTDSSVEDFEHQYLNELAPFANVLPTAEAIARIIAERMLQGLTVHQSKAIVTEVELWETPVYRISYRP